MPAKTKSKPVTNAADIIAMMASTKGTGKTDAKPTITVDAPVKDMIAKYLHCSDEAKAMKENADQARNWIIDQTKSAYYALCAQHGKALSSVRVGDATISIKNMYSSIPAVSKEGGPSAQAQALESVFGDDFHVYFRYETELSLNKDAANNADLLNLLIEKLGAEFFVQHFTASRVLKVNESLHTALNTDPDVRERALPLLAAEVIKPYSPSISR